MREVWHYVQTIDAFELWCWRRLLRVPWTARRSNQSILKEINSEYSLEGLMLKLKLQYFDHLMWRANSLKKTLTLEKIEGRRRGQQRKDGWMASLTQWTWVWTNSGREWSTEKPGVLQCMGLQRVGHDWATEQKEQLDRSMHRTIIFRLVGLDFLNFLKNYSWGMILKTKAWH